MSGVDHTALQKTWQQGQRWETRIVMTRDGPVENPVWVPVGERGFAEPLWDKNQEYRQVG